MRAGFRLATQLATARFAEMASGMDLQSEEQIAEDRAKKTFRGLENFFLASAPFLVLEAFRGHRLLAPTTTCSLGASRAAVSRYRRGRCASLLLGCPPGPLCLGCPAGPASWVPSGPARALGALRGRLLGCHDRALTEITIKKTFRAPESFFFTGSECTLNFRFFHSDGNQKKLSGARKVFFHSLHMLWAQFLPTSFSEFKINSPRLNCKCSPRTSSVLALNCAGKSM